MKGLSPLTRAGEEVSLNDLREWLEETGGDPGRHVMTDKEIAEDILKGDAIEEEKEDEGKESDVRIPKLSKVRGTLDSIITYIDLTADEESNQYYLHFRYFRDIITRRQHKQGKQLKIHSFFKLVATATQSDSPQALTNFQSPDSTQASTSFQSPDSTEASASGRQSSD